MLVATPNNLVDVKPRIISEIRKPYVQRSPSLDDLPRLSGILNYYCNILGIWSQKQVCVRDGCLLVYQDTSSFPYTPARGYASLGRPSSRRTPLQHTRSDSSGTPNSMDYYSGSLSLGRTRGAALAGLEFRLPLRHLNLMPSSLAPLAFTLSHHQNGNSNSPYVTFQALNELDYDRWVKTLAVEIMRQTPLEAIRFLDILGIASISTPSSKSCMATPTHTAGTKLTVREDVRDRNSVPKVISQIKVRWDRSPSSEGSTTSTDFSSQNNKFDISQTIRMRSRFFTNDNPLPRRKLCLKDIDNNKNDQENSKQISIIKNRSTPLSIKGSTSGRKSRDKVRRFRDKNSNGSSSEEARTIDEGIVLEERGSSSERSCRRTLWPSDRSDCLDSPHSVSSYSSYELCESPETISLGEELSYNDESRMKKYLLVDEPDCKIKDANQEHVSERIYCKNIVSPKTSQKNLLKKKCDKKVALVRTLTEEKKLFLEGMSQGNYECINTDIRSIPLFRAQPYNVTESNAILEETSNEPMPKNCVTDPLQSVNISNNDENFEVSQCFQNNHKDTWSRARSCSPTNRLITSDDRVARALSVGQPKATGTYSCVEVLKQRCQDIENYVSVKEKLVLFESLCSTERLARSSEELNEDLLQSIAPRARSLHDLTRERSPHVRDICQFFENFGKNKLSNNNKCNNQISENSKKKITNKEDMPPSLNFTVRCKSLSQIDTYDYKTLNNADSSQNNKLIFNTIKYKVKTDQISEESESDYKRTCYDSLNVVNMKIQNDTSLCDAYQYGQLKQIRLGNKIITYV